MTERVEYAMRELWSGSKNVVRAAAAALLMLPVAAAAQTPAVAGTVKAASATGLTVTDKTGKDVTVSLNGDTKLLQTAPGSTSLANATPMSAGDIAAGDRVLVSGSAGDDPATLHARRVVVMKAAAIAGNQAAEEAAWQRGGGGLVKSVDAVNDTMTLATGQTTLLVKTTPATKFTRYAPGSVKFGDAVGSTFAAVQPGDQLRVRGTRSDDGRMITADAVVSGSFRNFSGLLTAIDPATGTVTLKDLATKRTVMVQVTPQSDLRRLPEQAAARFAARASGKAVGPAGTEPGSTAARAGGTAGSQSAGTDLSQMLQRLPTETLGSLKVGDAVMIVASEGSSATTKPVAITMLAGVESILRAAPTGEMTLTPWSVGSGAPGGEGGQ